MLKDFISLLFPITCINCSKNLINAEESLCIPCQGNLPYLDSELKALEQRFWGKVDIKVCFGYLKYSKSGITQKLITALKYKGKQEVGVLMGKRFAFHLLQQNLYDNVDYIIPVPLHPKKERKRGFNQSLIIARAMAEVLNVPVLEDSIVRVSEQTSLTRMGRIERWLRSKEVYKAGTNAVLLKDKTVLIVDDVLTTGITLQTMAVISKAAGATEISLAALAVAV